MIIGAETRVRRSFLLVADSHIALDMDELIGYHTGW
jgi:hypothetical protein